jgi:hypothetical protein
MGALETTAALADYDRRGPGTDAERRAARWLARELWKQGNRVSVEPFWCRPNWALAHAWHVALALAGSLLSVSHPTVGAVLLAIALLSIAVDAFAGVSPGRRLTPEHASQNVVAAPATEGTDAKPVRLIVTANYDVGRSALVYRYALRRPAAWLRRAAGPLALGWLGILSLAIIWLLAIAVLRITLPHPGRAVTVLQLIPSVALVLTAALLLEAAGAKYGPAAADNATGTAMAIELVHALQSTPPRNLAPELLLQGAGAGQEVGIRRYLRAHRREVRRDNAVVLGIAPSGVGEPNHWRSDGRLIPIPYARRLRRLAATPPYRGRGGTPALPAVMGGVPAIAIGAVNQKGLAPRSPDHTDPETLQSVLEVGLALVEAIDHALDPDPETNQPERAATRA